MDLFKGNKMEATEFKQEPTRESLTQPPPGYQTPSTAIKRLYTGLLWPKVRPGARRAAISCGATSLTIGR